LAIELSVLLSFFWPLRCLSFCPQTPQWPKEEGQKDNQRSTKHHIVTRIPIKKTGVNFPLSFLQLSKRVSRNITIPGFLEATSINRDFKF
jgi:hypothetical protein